MAVTNVQKTYYKTSGFTQDSPLDKPGLLYKMISSLNCGDSISTIVKLCEVIGYPQFGALGLSRVY